MRKQKHIKEAPAVVQVKTGGSSLPWSDCTCREMKTMNTGILLRKFAVEGSREMINSLERLVS